MNPEGVTELNPGCKPRELTYRQIKCIGTPKPAGEEHKVRRGVLHPNISWLCVLPYGYSPFSFLFFTPRCPAGISPAGFGVPILFLIYTVHVPGVYTPGYVLSPLRGSLAITSAF